MEQEANFRAYISYSHDDEKLASWFHRAHESRRLPSRLAESIGYSNVRHIFRDPSDLRASENLSESLNSALRRSDALIVICSPDSSKSNWVNEEIRSFRQQKSDDRILAVIANGSPPKRVE